MELHNESTHTPQVIDCSMFFNEIELFKVRLSELYPYVTKFLVFEAEYTFSGQPKEPAFVRHLINDSFFTPYLDKVVWIPVLFTPQVLRMNAWEREYHTRNMMGEHVRHNASDTIVILSDLDEIPRGDTLHTAIEQVQAGKLVRLSQRLSYYYVNCVAPDVCADSRMFPISLLETHQMQDIRRMDGPVIENNGWHFSYMGGIERIQQKIAAYAHTELNQERYTREGNLWTALRNGIDLFGRDDHIYFFEDIDETYPRIIQENPDGMFDHLIRKDF